jgi:hypothetical protein
MIGGGSGIECSISSPVPASCSCIVRIIINKRYNRLNKNAAEKKNAADA